MSLKIQWISDSQKNVGFQQHSDSNSDTSLLCSYLGWLGPRNRTSVTNGAESSFHGQTTVSKDQRKSVKEVTLSTDDHSMTTSFPDPPIDYGWKGSCTLYDGSMTLVQSKQRQTQSTENLIKHRTNVVDGHGRIYLVHGVVGPGGWQHRHCHHIYRSLDHPEHCHDRQSTVDRRGQCAVGRTPTSDHRHLIYTQTTHSTWVQLNSNKPSYKLEQLSSKTTEYASFIFSVSQQILLWEQK